MLFCIFLSTFDIELKFMKVLKMHALRRANILYVENYIEYVPRGCDFFYKIASSAGSCNFQTPRSLGSRPKEANPAL